MIEISIQEHIKQKLIEREREGGGVVNEFHTHTDMLDTSVYFFSIERHISYHFVYLNMIHCPDTVLLDQHFHNESILNS